MHVLLAICLSMIGLADDPPARAPADSAGRESTAPETIPAGLEEHVRALREDDPLARVNAARAIAEMGPQGAPAIPALTEGLADDRWIDFDTLVAKECALALAAIGEAAVPAALVALRSDDFVVHVGGATVFDEMADPPDEALEYLRTQLDHEEPRRVRVAVLVIGAFEERAGEAVPQLIATLDHENLHVRYAACRTLARIGPAAKAAVPRLLKMLAEDVPSPRSHAALALGAIGTVPDHDVVGALVAAAGDSQSTVQERALLGLGDLGKEGEAALPALRERLADESFRNRVPAALAVWRISGRPDEAIPVLVELANDFNFNLDAIQALGKMGPDAAAAIPTLVALLEHRDPDVRMEVLLNLVRIDAEAARPHLEQAAANDSDEDVRAVAREALAPEG